MAPDVPVLEADELVWKVCGCPCAPPLVNVAIRDECSDDFGLISFSDPAQVSVYTPIVVRIFTTSALNPRFSPAQMRHSNSGIGGRDMLEPVANRWVAKTCPKAVSLAELLECLEGTLEDIPDVILPPLVRNSLL